MLGGVRIPCPPKPSPCLPTQACNIPFIVCPPDPSTQCWNPNFGGLDPCSDPNKPNPCPCPPVQPCDLTFLTWDSDYTECPDTSRTCTRSDECLLQPQPPPFQQPVKVLAQPEPKRKVPSSAGDYHQIKRNGNEKLPSTPTREVRQTKTARSGTSAERVFEVTLVDGVLHPQGARIPEGGKAWALNGNPGARLNLPRGSTAKFVIKQEVVPGKEPVIFYFSKDSIGPKNSEFKYRDPEFEGKIPGNAPILKGTPFTSDGTITLKLDDTIPSTLYYHSSEGEVRGGQIIVYQP